MNLELVWWERNISERSRSLIELPNTHTMFTDASFELLVIFITLKSFKTNFFCKHARIMSGSATAIAYVNNMDGSRLITCHKLAKQIWEWAKMQGAWILATCIPG